MAILKYCFANQIVCQENIIEFLLASLLLTLMFRGYKVISQDQNRALVRIDKFVYAIGMFQVVVVTVYFFLWGSDFLLSTIKCCNIFISAMICNILCTIAYEDSLYDRIWLILKVSLVLILMEWFWTAIVHKSLQEYNCFQIDYVLQSLTLSLTSLVGAYHGIKSLQIVENFKEEKKKEMNQGLDDQGTLAVMSEMDGRGFQIKILFIGEFLVAATNFFWDHSAYNNSYIPDDCSKYFYADSTYGIIGFTALKCVALLGIPFSLYLVFYIMNRGLFSTEKTQSEKIGNKTYLLANETD